MRRLRAQHVVNPEPFLLTAERQARRMRRNRLHVDGPRPLYPRRDRRVRGDEARALKLLDDAADAYKRMICCPIAAGMRRRRGGPWVEAKAGVVEEGEHLDGRPGNSEFHTNDRHVRPRLPG